VRADAQHLFRDAPLRQPFPQRAEAAFDVLKSLLEKSLPTKDLKLPGGLKLPF
jgi:hypothetical protein